MTSSTVEMNAPGASPAARRPSLARRAARRLGAGTAALAIGAAAVYAHTFVMDADALDAPLTTHAVPGAVAETGWFSMRLEQVVTTRTIRLGTPSTDPATGTETVKETEQVGTPDIFVVATVQATSADEPRRLKNAWLRARDGRAYQVTDRVLGIYTRAERPVQHGWWSELDYVFEVPKDALPGAEVVVTASSTNGVYDGISPGRYDQLLPEVALSLTTDDAAARRLLEEMAESVRLVVRP
ncbi:hypothetical protein Sme01_57640 [Sphaerisporangium melleum]|uniref:Uncharacterized protein n=1 Tax=Sphaerisporangium melleum TaxID=321316 RepID=A0A917VKZ9_9ACTN|nr:hypothetical protein [Sphaerisporangium melleum]GGK94903.1 hypothetical protein GCM10007964_41520 [Sphaerisporangium melleum]GII73288.1 hypothetical protein Sme01_57640 [Sphaerisporangium melleum]